MSEDVRAELACLVGQVAVASAELESSLRLGIQRTLLSDDDNWWVVEGQPMETLIRWLQMWIRNRDPYFGIWSESEHHDFGTLLDHIRKLNALRNTVIHGTWNTRRFLDQSEVRSGRLDPSRDVDDGSLSWYCLSSKRGDDGYREHMFTVDGLGELAGDLNITREKFKTHPVFTRPWYTRQTPDETTNADLA